MTGRTLKVRNKGPRKLRAPIFPMGHRVPWQSANRRARAKRREDRLAQEQVNFMNSAQYYEMVKKRDRLVKNRIKAAQKAADYFDTRVRGKSQSSRYAMGML